MGRKFKDLTGEKFGKLTAIRVNGRTAAGKFMWYCQCECGGETTVDGRDLTKGKTQSCGCLQKCKDKGYHSKDNKLHKVWSYMKTRCYSENCKDYKYYGGRGITVCDEWKDDFLTFQDWALSNGYEEGLTIDREDVNGNYEPNNCRWITRQEQSLNKTNNVWIEYKGDTLTTSQWAEILGVTPPTLRYHMNKGDVFEYIESNLKEKRNISTPIDINLLVVSSNARQSIEE